MADDSAGGQGGPPTGTGALIPQVLGKARRSLFSIGTGAIGTAALSQGWRMGRTDRRVLLLLDQLLGSRPHARVAVLAGRGPNRYAQVLRQALPHATVVRLQPRLDPSELHTRLTAGGPWDVILDDTGRPRLRGRLFTATFLHVRRGGAYVAVAFRSQERTLGSDRPAGGLGSLLDRLAAGAEVEVPLAGGQQAEDLCSLARYVESVRIEGDHLVVVNRGGSLAKLREDEMNRVLAARSSTDRVVARVEAATFASRCDFSSSTGRRHKLMPDTYKTPDISLREYHDAVCIPGQVVVKGNLVLPDTYRHNQRRRLRNRYTQELGPRFAAVAQDLDGVESLKGTYFYLDNEVRGHFGHAMTEQVSRLWALAEARKAAPDLKAILAINKGRELQEFEVALYGAAGFAREDLVFRHEPARVERLLAATPMLSMPEYIHPAIAPTWDALGDNLAAIATGGPTPDRIFVSRRIRKRACRNTSDVENLFTAHGFEVVYPEDFSLGDQVTMFRRASVIAGFAGSGLFNICFAAEKKTVIMLEHAAYTATNEYMIASVRGHDLVAVVSQVDRTESDEQKGVNQFQSSWSFDMDHEGRFLERILKQL